MFILRLRFLPLLLLFACSLATADSAELCQGHRIQVVYWSARDCAWCKRWEVDPALGPAFRRSWMFSRVDFSSVKKARLAEPYVAADYPPELDWLRARVAAGEIQTPRLVPAWSTFVDGRPIDNYLGTQAWVSRAVDDLRLLLREMCH